MEDDLLRIMANPYKIKKIKQKYVEPDLLLDFIESKFVRFDDKIQQELYKIINTFINTIDTDELEVKYILQDIVECSLYSKNT
tara:strand:- start:154 stop:402 length:249 start_codon:yes stop_codon:yes gene_type:complete